MWPDGKRFAFTVFDDTDSSSLDNVRDVYAFLRDCGFRTTKSVWMFSGDSNRGCFPGKTCDDPEYLEWLRQLIKEGFELGWHGATWHDSPRDRIIAALDRFVELFGHPPKVAANHGGRDSMYWGSSRLTGIHSILHGMLTRFRRRKYGRGHILGDEFFWGDQCRERIRYFRNFVFQDINTLKACPFMPYHDARRPLVNYWFASADGKHMREFNRCISEANQDRLEEEGGACIMYTHFACGFSEDGKPVPRFRALMERLAHKGGWFVPVSTLLDYLHGLHGDHVITDRERSQLERRWLWEKLWMGST